jgi:hypothetical protein
LYRSLVAAGTNDGNVITGDYTQNETAAGTYTMTESDGPVSGPTRDIAVGNFSLNETGSLSLTTAETGNTQDGSYTRTQSATDLYTLTEVGKNIGGMFTETVIGTDTPTLTESGNSANQYYSRSITGGGTYTLSESGTGGTETPGTRTNSYALTETSDARSGMLSQSETGTDRYGMLERYVNVANTSSGNQPGNMDYHPFGRPFVDPIVYRSDFTDAQKKEIEAILNTLIFAVSQIQKDLEHYGKDTTIGKIVTARVNRWFNPDKNLTAAELETVKGTYNKMAKVLKSDIHLFTNLKYGGYGYFSEIEKKDPGMALGQKYFTVPDKDKKAGLSEEQVRASTIFHELLHFLIPHDGQSPGNPHGIYYEPASIAAAKSVTYYTFEDDGKTPRPATLSTKQRLDHVDTFTGMLMQYNYTDDIGDILRP